MSTLLHLNIRCFVLVISVFVLNTHFIYAQGVGISDTTIVADSSSILELRSTTQGVLVPRVTSLQRDAIVSPADGLLIFNTSTAHFNFYESGWQIIGVNGGSGYYSVDAGTGITTTSTVETLVPGMTLTPDEGTYVVNFNSQCSIPDATYTTGFSTAIAKADLNLIYTDITNLTVTNTTHPLAFGAGETLTAGVYSLAGAISLAGTITLDGGGDPDAVFVIRSTGGAFASAAGVTVNLINGAKSSNIYWVAQGAMSIGAGTTFHGTLFSNSAAIAVGSTCTISGRLLTKGGAISFGPGTLSAPTDASFLDFRTLTSFVIFTGSGGIANAGASVYNGDISTDLGAITGFGTATVNGTIYPAGSTSIVTSINHEAIFSLYKNGVLIPNSIRTASSPSVISLQSVASVVGGETIEVRWKIDSQVSDNGFIAVGNRILSLIKVQ